MVSSPGMAMSLGSAVGSHREDFGSMGLSSGAICGEDEETDATRRDATRRESGERLWLSKRVESEMQTLAGQDLSAPVK